MAGFLIDQNLPASLAKDLRALGHNAVHASAVRIEKMRGAVLVVANDYIRLQRS